MAEYEPDKLAKCVEQEVSDIIMQSGELMRKTVIQLLVDYALGKVPRETVRHVLYNNVDILTDPIDVARSRRTG